MSRGIARRSSGPVAVLVQAVTAPDESTRVLLQLPDGHVLLWPRDARRIARMLDDTADEIAGPGTEMLACQRCGGGNPHPGTGAWRCAQCGQLNRPAEHDTADSNHDTL